MLSRGLITRTSCVLALGVAVLLGHRWLTLGWNAWRYPTAAPSERTQLVVHGGFVYLAAGADGIEVINAATQKRSILLPPAAPADRIDDLAVAGGLLFALDATPPGHFRAFVALLLSFAAAAHAQRVISFPNQGSGSANRAYFESTVLSAINNTSDEKVLQFDAGIYDFELPSWSGQMSAFTNVHNLTVRGHANGTLLRWRVQNDGEPHSFFVVDSASRNVQIENLSFTTEGYRLLDGSGNQVYDNDSRPLGVRHVDGTHIKIFGKHVRVFNCTFSWSPGHAVAVGSSSDPNDLDYIHISGNTFVNSIGDSIHVWTGSEVWIVGNTIIDSGDDAIAIYNDGYGSSDQRVPRQIHIESNNIQNGHWRGMLIGTSYDVGIWNNTIDGSARYGIEVTPVDTSYTPPNYWDRFPNIVIIRQNQIQRAGQVIAHQSLNSTYPDSNGVEVYSAWNVQLMDNTISQVGGFGARLRSCAQVGIGGGNSISSYGASYPGYLQDITGDNYAPAPWSWKWVNAWGTSN
jgi:hypothetical protein